MLAVTAPVMPNLPKPVRRKHNRLTQARLVDVLSLVALVDDAKLRRALVTELNPHAEAVQLTITSKAAGHAKSSTMPG